MIANEVLEVQNVLSSASRGRVSIRLPKVLNKVTGKKTNIPFLFSAALWLKPTNSYIKSLLGKPAGYLETTVQMAHTTLNDVTETPLGSLIDDDESEDDKRAMICKYLSFRRPLTDIHCCRILFLLQHLPVHEFRCPVVVFCRISCFLPLTAFLPACPPFPPFPQFLMLLRVSLISCLSRFLCILVILLSNA